MEPRFGWTLLSRDALRRADMQLREDVEGVRDEVGFLELHQAYADRFFPGTSVLHTRLRYVLFVPWMYNGLSQDPERHRITALIERREIALAGRLKAAGEQGVEYVSHLVVDELHFVDEQPLQIFPTFDATAAVTRGRPVLIRTHRQAVIARRRQRLCPWPRAGTVTVRR